MEDPTAIRERPIPYNSVERAWIREYVASQVELGVLRRVLPGEEEPTFTVGAVLVKEGQSQQKFRLCANLV